MTQGSRPGNVVVLDELELLVVVDDESHTLHRFAGTPVDVVLGGYHLAGSIEPRLVAPGHCTGWRAKVGLAHRFAPGRYAPSVVGARYHLTPRWPH